MLASFHHMTLNHSSWHDNTKILPYKCDVVMDVIIKHY